jgi:PAS domain S-box-containing protein
MKTKTRILLSIATSFAISALILFFVFVILREIDKEADRVRAYASVQDKTAALNLSIAKFTSQSDASRIRQIKSVRDSLEKLLGTLKSFDVREESLLRQIRTNAHELAYSLEKLVSSSGEPGAMRAERLEVLVSQLAMKIQFISDDTLRLMEISQSQIHDAQRQAGILILILILSLIVANAAISIFSGRIVMRVQGSLRDSLAEAERKGRVLEATMEQLRQSEQRYRALFDSIEEGFCVFELICDDNGRVVDWVYLETNPAFERRTGWKDPVGRRIREFLPDLEDGWFDRYARIAATGESMRFDDQTTFSDK